MTTVSFGCVRFGRVIFEVLVAVAARKSPSVNFTKIVVQVLIEIGGLVGAELRTIGVVVVQE